MADQFAPYQKFNTSFIVENIISGTPKIINIFQYPIPVGAQRDLLKIPYVSEADIRASLLKGEIMHKLRAGEIKIVFSDIDLLQFNADQRAFLQQSGVLNGLQISSSQLDVTEIQDVQLNGTVDGVNTIFTAPDGVWLQTFPYKIIVYNNGVKQVLGDDYFIAESGGPGSGYDTVIFSVPPDNTLSPVDVITADYYISNTNNGN